MAVWRTLGSRASDVRACRGLRSGLLEATSRRASFPALRKFHVAAGCPAAFVPTFTVPSDSLIGRYWAEPRLKRARLRVRC